MKSLVGIDIKKYLSCTQNSNFEKVDILSEVYHLKMTSDNAKQLYETLFEKFHEGTFQPQVTDYLSLSVCERTAIVLHGISFGIVAKWRYEGWPNRCVICNNSLDFEEDAWRAFSKITMGKNTYSNILVHWDCFSNLQKQDNILIRVD